MQAAPRHRRADAARLFLRRPQRARVGSSILVCQSCGADEWRGALNSLFLH